MNQVEVVALSGFEHNGRRILGDRFPVSELHAKALKDRGLVSLAEDGEQKGKTSAASTARTGTGKNTTRAPREKSSEAAVKLVGDLTVQAGKTTAADPAITTDLQQAATASAVDQANPAAASADQA